MAGRVNEIDEEASPLLLLGDVCQILLIQFIVQRDGTVREGV